MQFGPPQELVSDKGKHFLNDVIAELNRMCFVLHRFTTPYNPKAAGLIERCNQIIGKAMKKVVDASKSDWDLKLASLIFAYNTTSKSTTGRSPFYLVYGQEAMQLIEMEVETIRVLEHKEKSEEEGLQNRLTAIDGLEEYRTQALELLTAVQYKRKKTYDKKLPSLAPVKEGDLVLLYDSKYKKFPGKLHMRWMGPYKTVQMFDNRSLQLETLQGQWFDTRVNGSRVKKFFTPEMLYNVTGACHGCVGG